MHAQDADLARCITLLGGHVLAAPGAPGDAGVIAVGPASPPPASGGGVADGALASAAVSEEQLLVSEEA